MTASNVSPREERAIRARQTVRIVVGLVLLAVLVLLALVNDSDVEVDWIVSDGTAPLYVVILVSAAVGFLIGTVASWRRHH